MRALIVSANVHRRRRFAENLLHGSCDIHTVNRGFEAIDHVRKHAYDVVVVDDSLSDLGPLEFTLALRDMGRANTRIFVAAPEYRDKFKRLGAATNVEFIGAPDAVARRLAESVDKNNGGSGDNL